MKLIVLGFLLAALCCALISAKALSSDSHGLDNDETRAVDLLRRITRQAVKPTCKYQNGPSACGPKTKKRTRIFSLEKVLKSESTCKYQKGPWSACDPQTKKRTRTFSLKKGPKSECEEVKVLSKDCKGKRQKQKNNSKNRDRQRQNKKQEKNSRNKQQQQQQQQQN